MIFHESSKVVFTKARSLDVRILEIVFTFGFWFDREVVRCHLGVYRNIILKFLSIEINFNPRITFLYFELGFELLDKYSRSFRGM